MTHFHPLSRSVLGLIGVACLSVPCVAEELDATTSSAVEKFVDEFREMIGARAASLAISRNGHLIHERAFGSSDADGQQPTTSRSYFRIASVTKPITAAAVQHAIQRGQFKPSTPAMAYLKLEASGDERLSQITVEHLLRHQGGWDRTTTFDPMTNPRRVASELMLSRPASQRDIIDYMLSRPLQFQPGEKTSYSNFGYCLLGRILERTAEKPYYEVVRDTLWQPDAITGIQRARNDLDQRPRDEVTYPDAANALDIELLDSCGGLIATAPALCQFLDHYWINGQPRQASETADWTFFGSLPGTTAMVRQRPDGLNIAVLFNGRRDASFNDDNHRLRERIDDILSNEAGR